MAATRIVRTPGNNVLTEHGPKLLPISIVCKQPGFSGFFDKEVCRTSIGYAYAGATLPPLATQSLANALFQTFAGPEGAHPPGLKEIAEAIAEIAKRYMREVGELSGAGALHGNSFGFCAQSNRFRAFKLEPKLSPGSLSIETTEHDFILYGDDSLLVIGSCPDYCWDGCANYKDPTLLLWSYQTFQDGRCNR